MCSIGEDDFGDEGGLHAIPIPESDIAAIDVSSQTICWKCGQTNSVYKLKNRQAECEQCFLAYVRHKFRATLGVSKVILRNATVLLIFDGSAESLVLLDMLQHALTLNMHKRLHCNVIVLHIDDYQLQHTKPNSQLEHIEYLLAIKNILARYSFFKCHLVPINYKEPLEMFSFENINAFVNNITEHESELLKRIQAINTLTKRQDYLKRRRNHVIAKVASHLKCKYAFVPEYSKELAAELLTAVALGRGGSVALDVALIDDRLIEGVKLVRPLKELNAEEVELYIKAQKLEPLPISRYGKAEGCRASLPNLIEAFVHKLQSNYPSTISTISRVGEKLAPNRDKSFEKKLNDLHLNNVNSSRDYTQVNTCRFCNSPLDTANSTILLMTEYSRLVSKTGTIVSEINDFGIKAQEEAIADENELLRQLCFACRKIQNSCSSDELLLNT
ncbi:cytoplasmic tRNA 2-thiolation protein 2 [Teleopsis dalmanni]|uniref:cytoplasmic tRNA 2-thiolation protein 2 n=1 Tax=Teleopsis dalmanni TaxID=139649 RepID=UPI0018CEBA46|nr:cytoplasmic tRNA 2-thiolation protein 2 [Teleopsis dalmanni]